jgi:hypothetical protein
MSWTFYDAQGREKRATSAVGGRPVEVSSAALAALTAVTTANNGTYVLWPGSAITITEPGHYLLTTNPIFSAAGTAVLSQGNVAIYKNGVSVASAAFVDHATFLGSSIHPYEYVDCLAGDVIDLRYSTNNVPVNFGACKLYAVKQTVGPQGRGGKWWVSGVTYGGVLVNVPGNVVAPIMGDVFLYPDSGDTFSYDGASWVYTGPLPAVGAPPVVTSLPSWAAVVDGQQLIYAPNVAAAVASPQYPVAWHLVANKGHTPPWQDGWMVTGGEPLLTGTFPRWDVTLATGVITPWVGGPSITLPRGGQWRFRFGPVVARLASTATAGAASTFETGLIYGTNNWIGRKQHSHVGAWSSNSIDLEYTANSLQGDVIRAAQVLVSGSVQGLFDNVEAGVNLPTLSAMPVYLDP